MQTLMLPTRAEFEDFLLNRENEANRPRLAPKSATHYARRLVQAEAFLQQGLENLTAGLVLHFIAAQGGSPSNHDSWVNFFKHLYAWGKWAGVNVQDFTAKLKHQKRPQRLPKPFTVEEIQKVFASIPTHTQEGRRDLALHHILYSNLRNEEVCNLQVLNFLNKEVRVIGKGDKERFVPLNDVAWETVLRYILETQYGEHYSPTDNFERVNELFYELRSYLIRTGRNPWVFTTNSGQKMYDRALRTIVSERAEAAGVKDAHPHRYRHSFATHILDNGATDLIALKDVMGHTKLSTTEIYVQVSSNARFNRVNAFHPFQKP